MSLSLFPLFFIILGKPPFNKRKEYMRSSNDLKDHLIELLQSQARGEENGLTIQQISTAATALGLDHQLEFEDKVENALEELYQEGKLAKAFDEAHGISMYYVPQTL